MIWILYFPVSESVCNSRSGNHLHARGAALVNDGRFSAAPMIWMGVVFASAAEGVICFGEQLQHQLIGGEFKSE